MKTFSAVIIVSMTTLKLCTDKQEWDDYILDNGGHPLQLWGWGDVKTAHGWQADRLFAYDDNEERIGAVQLLIRKLPLPLRSLAYVPRGPVTTSEHAEDLLNELANYVKRVHKSVAVSVEPDAELFSTPDGWVKSTNTILPSSTIVLDLTKPESELLALMAKKTRQYIRKSAAEGTIIKQIHSRDELSKCLDMYHQTARRAKFDLHDDAYYYDIFDKMGDYIVVYATYMDNQPIAFLWLAISGDVAFEQYGGMNEAGQSLRANYALKWHAIRKTREWGLKRYDFGGLIGGGVTNFKMGWTNQPTELAGTFDKGLSKWYGLWQNGLPTAKKVVRKLRPKRR